MAEFGAPPRKRKKQRFGAKPPRRGARLFGAPPKKQNKDRKFGRADKQARRDKAFGKPENNKRGDDWGKMATEARKEEAKARRGITFGFVGGFFKRKRRAAELGRYWTVRDEISDQIQRRQVAIEARFKDMGDEIGQLVNAVTGKPLSGDQKVKVANYIDRKKSEVQESGGLMETVIGLVGSLFGKGKGSG